MWYKILEGTINMVKASYQVVDYQLDYHTCPPRLKMGGQHMCYSASVPAPPPQMWGNNIISKKITNLVSLPTNLTRDRGKG